jgi:glycosyltransferase involved in cell wall biosynthesis
MLPTISLVTCSYQQGRFLRSTMESVLRQGYPSLEYLVIDGGSRDGSVDIIREYAPQLAYWVSEKDAGQTDALIKGFERSSGEIMGWLCSDDLLLPGALQAVGEFFQRHPDVDMVYGDALWVDAQGAPLRAKKEIPWDRFIFLFDHNYLAQPSAFWRRRLYERCGGLDRRLHLTMDSDLWLRFSRQTQPVHLPQYLSCMRFYAEQKTRALKGSGRREDEALRRREAPYLASLPRAPLHSIARLKRWIAKALAGGYGARVPSEYLTTGK